MFSFLHTMAVENRAEKIVVITTWQQKLVELFNEYTKQFSNSSEYADVQGKAIKKILELNKKASRPSADKNKPQESYFNDLVLEIEIAVKSKMFRSHHIGGSEKVHATLTEIHTELDKLRIVPIKVSPK